MRPKSVLLLFLSCCFAFCEASFSERNVESRGKKKKIALFVYIADLIVKKFFFLKLIYAALFFVLIHKAGFFFSWFLSYIKEKKEHHEHLPHYEYGHDHHPHYEYGQHYEYSPHQSYGAPAHGPYKRTSSENKYKHKASF